MNRMWEIRERDGEYRHKKFGMRKSKDEVEEAYECGYEEGYKEAMEEAHRSEFGSRRMGRY